MLICIWIIFLLANYDMHGLMNTMPFHASHHICYMMKFFSKLKYVPHILVEILNFVTMFVSFAVWRFQQVPWRPARSLPFLLRICSIQSFGTTWAELTLC